jgi:hypothetical protein
VLLLSQVLLLVHQGGAEFVLRAYERVLAHGVAVKLPAWPGLDSFAEGLARRGVPLLDPAVACSELISQVPLVISNGASSVLAEAALAGHRPVCVLDPDVDGPHNRGLSWIDLVVCTDDEFPVAVKAAGWVREPGPSFDVDRFLLAINERLAGTGHG